MTFKVEDRKVFILARSFDVAMECAKAHQLISFQWAMDYTLIDTWDKVAGYNKDNSVIWLADGFHWHPQFLYVQHLAETFSIPIEDKTKEPICPYLMPQEVTIQ